MTITETPAALRSLQVQRTSLWRSYDSLTAQLRFQRMSGDDPEAIATLEAQRREQSAALLKVNDELGALLLRAHQGTGTDRARS